MTGSRQTFQEGAGAFRNARDWAKEQRDRLIASANDKASELYPDTVASDTRNSSQATISGLFEESDTSADELALDEDAFARHVKEASS
jgi:hypothetical protein